MHVVAAAGYLGAYVFDASTAAREPWLIGVLATGALGFGEIAATYTAGFAAKTALIIVKDLTTGDVGAGWLNTYVASTVAIQGAISGIGVETGQAVASAGARARQVGGAPIFAQHTIG